MFTKEGRIPQVTTLHAVLRKQVIKEKEKKQVKLFLTWQEFYIKFIVLIPPLLTYLQTSYLHFIGELYFLQGNVEEKHFNMQYFLNATQA